MKIWKGWIRGSGTTAEFVPDLAQPSQPVFRARYTVGSGAEEEGRFIDGYSLSKEHAFPSESAAVAVGNGRLEGVEETITFIPDMSPPTP